MYCSKCGKEVRDDAKFCNHCGNKLVTVEKDEPAKPSNSIESLIKSDDVSFRKKKMYACLLICVALLLTPFMSVFHMTYAEVIKISGTYSEGNYDYSEEPYFSKEELLKEHDLSIIDMFNQMRYRMGQYNEYSDKISERNTEARNNDPYYDSNNDIERLSPSKYLYLIFLMCIIAVLIIAASLFNVIGMFKNISTSDNYYRIFFNNAEMAALKIIIGNVFFWLSITIVLHLDLEKKNEYIYGGRIFNTFENFGISFWFILIIVICVLIKVFSSKEVASTYEVNKKKDKNDDTWVCTCGHRNPNEIARCEICKKINPNG